ncbi:hypothetical protein DYB37_012991 [Aphanomyces astaci]|uniref:2-methoxy-6-polyprenyl-1,4-benzoquinol methylase, mitochondrial n=1 Tax=Aphanomyces astaci TaxID=112090 RepID=A0A397BKE7_APHAT|nr:hypothetical protein DYB36_000330 [Aphanomyces astaci]RHY39783.1 hypothetical protein DYB38_000819 [Aphanomyces astaci]RHY54438.1 hypothetical protein DYB34_001312 [Aphanomyces astaci]RHY72178.1 hypothetical protein DYB30_009127 [Aphanomyces astaci]RHY93625.1 hypothetical protein DYB35_000655 [Aphanomyces astaci]
MSGGMHRLWKDEFVNMLGPLPHRNGEPLRILDVAGGTGDIAFRMADRLKRAGLPDSPTDDGRTDIVVCDINGSMLRVGEERATARGIGLPGTRPSFAWVEGDAEQLKFEDNSFDVYTIAFGIRNVTHVDYLVESIRQFPPQDTFKTMIETAGFQKVSYTNFMDGIVAVHSGFKL